MHCSTFFILPFTRYREITQFLTGNLSLTKLHVCRVNVTSTRVLFLTENAFPPEPHRLFTENNFQTKFDETFGHGIMRLLLFWTRKHNSINTCRYPLIPIQWVFMALRLHI